MGQGLSNRTFYLDPQIPVAVFFGRMMKTARYDLIDRSSQPFLECEMMRSAHCVALRSATIAARTALLAKM